MWLLRRVELVSGVEEYSRLCRSLWWCGINHISHRDVSYLTSPIGKTKRRHHQVIFGRDIDRKFSIGSIWQIIATHFYVPRWTPILLPTSVRCSIKVVLRSHRQYVISKLAYEPAWERSFDVTQRFCRLGLYSVWMQVGAIIILKRKMGFMLCLYCRPLVLNWFQEHSAVKEGSSFLRWQWRWKTVHLLKYEKHNKS